MLEFGRFRLDVKERVLSVDGVAVPLTPKVLDLLILLVQNPGHLLEKDRLLSTLWPETFVEEANLSVHISTLRRALETAGGEHYIETVPKRGYRFTADVRELTEATVESARPPTRRLTWQVLLLGGLCLAGCALLIQRWLFHPISSLADVRSMAVLPFRPLAGAGKEDAILGIGMADAVIRELSSIRRIAVRPTSAVQKYYSLLIDPKTAARELEVDVVMEGRIQRSGQLVRVSVQLLRTGDGSPIWADRFDDYYTNIFQLQDSISEKVASALKMKLSEADHVKMTKRGTVNIEAYESYLQGDYCEMSRTPESPLSGCIEDYRAAVAKDPSYALAYAGIARVCMDLADSYTSPKTREQCRVAAQRAISIDDSLAEGHLALGNVLFRADWNWLAAEREFKRGLTLDEYSPMAHRYMALLLLAMNQKEYALDEMKKAHLLDPSSLNIRVGLAWAYDCNGRSEEAIRELQKTIAMSFESLDAHRELGRAYLHVGNNPAALAEFNSVSRLDTDNARSMDLDYLKAIAQFRSTGKSSALTETMERLQLAGRPAYEIAVLEANLGRLNEAFRALEQAANLRLKPAIWMLVDPELDPLKRDERFNALVRRLHLLN